MPEPIQNWSRSVTSRPQRIERPRNLGELRAVVQSAAADHRVVRPVGHAHSVNECFTADDETQICMRDFRRDPPITVNRTARTITVGADVTLLQIRDALRPDLELPVSPEIGNATAGSVACAGTKDGSIGDRAPGIGQISSSVIRVEIVDAAGNSRSMTGHDLHHFRSSHGLMGIAYEVTFQAIERKLLQIEYEWISLEPYDLDRVFRRTGGRGRAHGVLAFIQPYAEKLLVERRTLIDGGEPDAKDRIKRIIRDWIWEWGQSVAVAKADSLDRLARLLVRFLPSPKLPSRLRDPLIEALGTVLDEVLGQVASAVPPDEIDRAHLPDILDRLSAALSPRVPLFTEDSAKVLSAVLGDTERRDVLLELLDSSPALLEIIGGYRAHRSDSMLDFQEDRWPLVFEFTFWAFPRDRWSQIVPEFVAFCQEFRDTRSYRPAIFAEIYFIDQDPHSVLSFSPDGPIFTLNLVDSPRDVDTGGRWDRRWFEMNEEFNRWAVGNDKTGHPRGGRPILNQTKELLKTPGVLPRAFGPAWPAFQGAISAADRARFLTSYFRQLGV